MLRSIRCLLLLVGLTLPQIAQAQSTMSPVDPGSAAFMHGDYALALQEWAKKAEAGDAEAINNIGILYNKGFGVEKDAKKAAVFYRKAAEMGFANAQFNLANLYYAGNGVERSLGEAAQLYRAAADRGHQAAQYYLGLMYIDGEGVPQDKAQGLAWIRRAADADNVAAQFTAGQLMVEDDNAPADIQKGAEYVLASAQAGHPKAALLMAQLYNAGKGAEKNDLEAYIWARIAADRLQPGQDSRKAQNLIDDLEGRLDDGAIKAAERVIAIRNPKPEAAEGETPPQ
ncbi:tetratricopeptide repeat protein [Dongia sp.]|uniref:tetratricopeptide repeat protein n=1 Tax=Dongia sp. TaxID=1977262 RepID=UPI0035B4F5F2